LTASTPTDGIVRTRPAVAIIANSLPPYRLHLHRRLARELPQVEFFSLFTHEESNAPWKFQAIDEINPMQFGPGESSAMATRPGRLLHEWRKGRRITRWMESNGVRAVIILGYNDPGRLHVIRWCRRRGIPCFLFGDSNIRGDRARGVKGWVKRAFVTRVVRSCTGVMPCGSLGEAYFRRYGAAAEAVFYTPYEPDYGMIGGLSADVIEKTRRDFALDALRRRIVFSGGLQPVKRPDMLLESFLTIAAERPDWDLLMVGDGPLRAGLERRIPAALAGRVKFTGFLDDQEVISALYRLSDVLVLPSAFEPWAVVINEAVAAGLAVVATDVVGAAAELVRDGVNGRIVPVDARAELTAALRDVTADANRMKGASAAVLADWRRRADPVEGVRRALASAGVLPGSSKSETGDGRS
jgi:glycosyltransferase involved in cell wall biosynthesis